jgi:hypothetical protein
MNGSFALPPLSINPIHARAEDKKTPAETSGGTTKNTSLILWFRSQHLQNAGFLWNIG